MAPDAGLPARRAAGAVSQLLSPPPSSCPLGPDSDDDDDNNNNNDDGTAHPKAEAGPVPRRSAAHGPASAMLSPPRTSARRESRRASVTPRKFAAFFTPRSTRARATMLSEICESSRQALRKLGSASANSRRPATPPPPPASDLDALEEHVGEIADGGADENATEDRRMNNKNNLKRKDLDLGLADLPEAKRRQGGSGDGAGGEGAVQEDGAGMPAAPALEDALPLPSREQSVQARSKVDNFFRLSRKNQTLDAELKSSPGVTIKRSANGTSISFNVQGPIPQPIRRFESVGEPARSLFRELGDGQLPGRRHLLQPFVDPRTETARFYSNRSDRYLMVNYDRSPQSSGAQGQGQGQGHGESLTIPFSVAPCHHAPLTAVGDEQGYIRLLCTDGQPPFAAAASADGNDYVENRDGAAWLRLKVHDNAIMDLAFSHDDLRLATASGDRTGRVIDVMTQAVAAELRGGHGNSLRRVAFQPGATASSVIATSDRDGRVQIWDLRCSSVPVAVNFTAAVADPVDRVYYRRRDPRCAPAYPRTVGTIDGAHARISQGVATAASVTALQWLPAGREHLLLTASEASASVRLWDTRFVPTRRQPEPVALAATPAAVAASHRWRAYGLTSLALGTDASRLYALCKDGTVYAFSTEHLVLGRGPEMAARDEMGASAPPRRRRTAGLPADATCRGLAPLYGFRHDQFRAHTFYVKLALRRDQHRQSELLAVGSSDSCAVLFPTDEDRHVRAWLERRTWAASSRTSGGTSGTPGAGPGSPSPSSSGSDSSDPIPVVRNGAALIRGHSREVTALGWTHDGALITASDDRLVRRWRSGGTGDPDEDPDRARELRTGGEFGGLRHQAGWADVAADWDACDE